MSSLSSKNSGLKSMMKQKFFLNVLWLGIHPSNASFYPIGNHFEKYLRSNYELVNDESGMSFVLEKGGHFLECDKTCFLPFEDDECDTCTVGDQREVYCRYGKVTKSCHQLCCKDINAGSHNRANKVGYSWMDEESATIFTIENRGNRLECSKYCFLQNDGGKCDQCIVHADWYVQCKRGEIGISCRQECCGKEYRHSIHNEYKSVEDLGPYDDPNKLTIMPYNNGKTTKCRKNCIDEKSDYKCSECVLDHENDIFCIKGRIPLTCQRACCDGELDEFSEVTDYLPNDDALLLIYHQHEYYSCDPLCIADEADEKCDLCKVDENLTVKCDEGRVHQSCRRECCKLLVW